MLFESARATAIEFPLNKPTLKRLVLETIRKNNLCNAYVKMIVTRSVGELPLLSPYNCKPSIIVFAKPYMKLVEGETHDKGRTVKTSSMRKIPTECWDPRIKAINYLNHVLMRLEAN